MKSAPLLIVLTPVYNEAWILQAFLKATSLWADCIIIADQMSDDGSRELYKQFPKVKVIDNPRKEMHQAATRRLLFEEAKKIEGDKILFALDADEFLSGNFVETEGWRTIMNSEQGDVFKFSWMLLNTTGDKYRIQNQTPYYWAVHVNDVLFDGMFPDNFIDEWRLPWPEKVNHEYVIKDISFLHLHDVNTRRQHNKTLFYQVLQYAHSSNAKGGTYFYRRYKAKPMSAYFPLPEDVYDYYKAHGVNLWDELNLNDVGEHYVKTVQNKVDEIGASALRKLDIWNEECLSKYGDPRHPIDKLMHWYFRKTQKYCSNFFIRYTDKVLKRLY